MKRVSNIAAWMNSAQEQRLDIGRRIYHGELSNYEAAKEFGISDGTARDYMRLYRDVNNLPSKQGTHKKALSSLVKEDLAIASGLETYESMTKDELIKELIKSKIAEARLKKGYEVKGDGTVIQYDSQNTR